MTMSRNELNSFVQGCKIFKDPSRVAHHIDRCFAAANSEEGVAQKKKPGEEDDNPDEEFQGCFQNIRRNETPNCYRDLTDAVSSEFDTTKHHIVKYTKKSTAS